MQQRRSRKKLTQAVTPEPAASPNQNLQLDEAWISAELQKRERLYAALVEEARFILEEKVNERGIKIHAIEGRVKSLESIVTKCKSKGISDPFHDLFDLAGCRVICLLRSDINAIGEIIKEEFDVVEVDDKILSDVNSFGYMSVHYIVTLKEAVAGPRYERLKV